MTAAIKPAQSGSITNGTLQTGDLLGAFSNALARSLAENESYFQVHDKDRGELERLAFAAVQRAIDLANDKPRDRGDAFMLDYLTEVLNQFAPKGHTFGLRERGGSDFGFWPTEKV